MTATPSGPFLVEADFLRDWVDYLLANLGELRCRIDPTRDPEHLAIAFFNALSRRVPSQPRRVLVASDFVCPPGLREGLDLLKLKVERGDDLTPHLSTAIETHADPAAKLFSDGLLNDWGIHHFHLGIVPDSKNPAFVARTDDLLFARVTENAFYMIAVLSHPDAKNPRTWTDQRLVRILHRDWPDSIQHLRLKGFVGVDPSPNDEDIARSRKAGITMAIPMSDGTVYRPLGGGYATSRVGVEVADAGAYYTHAVRWIEHDVRKNAPQLAAMAADNGHVLGRDLWFRFVAFMPGHRYRIMEENSKVMFSLPIPR